MICKHEPFEFDGVYEFRNLKGSCDNCGNLYTLDLMLLQYTGDLNDVHTFHVLFPFYCVGCHKNIETQKVICGGISVEKEFNNIQRNK